MQERKVCTVQKEKGALQEKEILNFVFNQKKKQRWRENTRRVAGILKQRKKQGGSCVSSFEGLRRQNTRPKQRGTDNTGVERAGIGAKHTSAERRLLRENV